MERNVPMKRPLQYRLYYDPEFDYRTVKYKHVSATENTRTGVRNTLGQYIDALVLSIKSEGVKNPIQIHYVQESAVVHPGKTRCAALEILNIFTVPAVIFVKGFGPYSPSKTAYEIKPEDVDQWLTGDNVAEYNTGYFNIKKLPRRGR